VRAALDATLMQMAAERLPGTHDFGAFGQSPKGESTVRTVFHSAWTSEPPLLVYRIEANAFLQHMVRRIVGMLVAVGRGAMTVNEFEAIFQSRQIAPGIALAPPQGLVLEQVKYPGEGRPSVAQSPQFET
jgi:tRNA pseudouridine38-40 synthase